MEERDRLGKPGPQNNTEISSLPVKARKSHCYGWMRRAAILDPDFPSLSKRFSDSQHQHASSDIATTATILNDLWLLPLILCTMDYLVIVRPLNFSVTQRALIALFPSKCSDIIFCHKNKNSINQLHNERISNLLYKFLSSLCYLFSLALPGLSTTALL